MKREVEKQRPLSDYNTAKSKKLNSHGGKTEGGGGPTSHVAKERAAKMDAAILFQLSRRAQEAMLSLTD